MADRAPAADRSLTLAELAERTGSKVEGDAAVRVSRVATLKSAHAGAIAFLSNPKYRADVAASGASAFIVSQDNAALTAKPRLISTNPYACFARVAALLDARVPHLAPLPFGIPPSAGSRWILRGPPEGRHPIQRPAGFGVDASRGAAFSALPKTPLASAAAF